MSYLIKRFNDEGIIKFNTLLQEFKIQKNINATKLLSLINDVELTEEIEGHKLIQIPANNNKFEIAKYLSELLDLQTNRRLYRDKGLWTWLSALMLELLVPFEKKSTQRDFKEKALYILESDTWNRYYRHLLAFASLTYTELGNKGKIFLRGPIFERGEIVEQLAAVYNIQRNSSIIEAATLLFYNAENDTIFKGAADKFKGGTARRLREVLKQFQLTFDLNSMDGPSIVRILPFEFKKWKKAS